jgi:hypothetical protein
MLRSSDSRVRTAHLRNEVELNISGNTFRELNDKSKVSVEDEAKS